jgi:Zn-dependent protease with chaperone function
MQQGFTRRHFFRLAGGGAALAAGLRAQEPFVEMPDRKSLQALAAQMHASGFTPMSGKEQQALQAMGEDFLQGAAHLAGVSNNALPAPPALLMADSPYMAAGAAWPDGNNYVAFTHSVLNLDSEKLASVAAGEVAQLLMKENRDLWNLYKPDFRELLAYARKHALDSETLCQHMREMVADQVGLQLNGNLDTRAAALREMEAYNAQAGLRKGPVPLSIRLHALEQGPARFQVAGIKR